MLSAGTIAALILVGASAMYGLVLVGFAKARRRVPLSWFALSCLMMGIYSIAMVVVTVPSAPDYVIGWTGSVGYSAAAIFTMSATRYVYHRVGKNYSHLTRSLEIALLVTSFVVFLPGIVFDQTSLRQWEFFQTSYRFPHSTHALVLCGVVIILGFANLLRVTSRLRPRLLLFGCICLVVAGAQDIAISLYLYEANFVAAAGALVFLVFLALDEAVQWGDEAKQLRDLKATLEQRVQQRSEELSNTLLKLARNERLAALGRMSASIGHEINNPLTYVMMNLELLRQESGIKDREALEHASEGAERIAGIVSQLRVLSKAKDQTAEVVDIDDVLNVAVRTLEHKTNEYKRVELDSSPNAAYVLGDRLRLIQLFINLLSNSLESLSDDGRTRKVEVRSTVSEDEVTIRLADQGRGIPQSIRDHLFEPFATGRSDGLGLGLAIVRTIADELGGTIAVESQEGEGSIFTVTLPLTQQLPQPTVANESLPQNPNRNPHILIIDDETELTRSLARSLSDYQVTTCTDGNDALNLLRQSLFDVVVCDLVMPGLTGLEVVEQTQQERPIYDGRFILMSGGIPSMDMRKRLEKNNTPYLSKPFHTSELRQLISEKIQ